MKYAESKNLTAYDVLIIASMIEKEVHRPQGAPARRRGHLQPPEGRDAARDRRDHPLRLRHPADAGDPPEPARLRLAVQHAQDSRACRRRRSRTPGLASIQAAAHPDDVDYLFFVRKADCKSHFFTASQDGVRQLPARWAAVLSATSGLIGNPVDALALAAHAERRLRRAGLDWKYVLLPIEDDAARGDGRGAGGPASPGANVTVPHKAAVIPFLDEVDDFAERAGSVNTIVVQRRAAARLLHRRARGHRGDRGRRGARAHARRRRRGSGRRDRARGRRRALRISWRRAGEALVDAAGRSAEAGRPRPGTRRSS